MIKIEQIHGKNIFLFKITDDIDQAGAEKFINFLASKADNDEKIKMIVIMESIRGFESFRAFVKTMEMKSKAISVVEKYAVLSDKDWIEKIAPIGDFVIPGMSIKHFAIKDRDLAISWLEESN